MDATLSDADVAMCTSGREGGGLWQGDGSLTIEGTSFSDNAASQYGDIRTNDVDSNIQDSSFSNGVGGSSWSIIRMQYGSAVFAGVTPDGDNLGMLISTLDSVELGDIAYIGDGRPPYLQISVHAELVSSGTWTDGSVSDIGAFGGAWAEDIDYDGDLVLASEGDCDDSDATTFPGAPEVPYDGADNDCSGDSDLDDLDGDGVAGGSDGTDCDDADASVHPGADDVAGDGIDQDCDGSDATEAEDTPSVDDTAPAEHTTSRGCAALGRGEPALLLLAPLLRRRHRRSDP